MNSLFFPLFPCHISLFCPPHSFSEYLPIDAVMCGLHWKDLLPTNLQLDYQRKDLGELRGMENEFLAFMPMVLSLWDHFGTLRLLTWSCSPSRSWQSVSTSHSFRLVADNGLRFLQFSFIPLSLCNVFVTSLFIYKFSLMHANFRVIHFLQIFYLTDSKVYKKKYPYSPFEKWLKMSYRSILFNIQNIHVVILLPCPNVAPFRSQMY